MFVTKGNYMSLRLLWIRIVVCLLLFISVLVSANAANKTKFSLRDWMAKNDEFKVKLVQGFINLAKVDNVIIRMPVDYYVREMDLLIENTIKNRDESGLDNSYGVALKTIMIMDGDWDNGEDKLELAKKHMGPQNFETFVKKYPDKYQKLLKTNKTVKQ